MRSLRTLTVACGLVGIAPAFAAAQATPEYLLKTFNPNLKGVDYELPTDPEVIKACKVETVYNANKRAIGYSLRDGQGKLLRKFLDTNGNRELDQWSYYQDGFEVYRENDLNADKMLDECRWLNAGGTRIATVKLVSGGSKGSVLQVTGWKRLSAEEASKVFVQALVSGDRTLMETVMAAPEELAELGVPKGMVDQVAEAARKRVDQVNALQAGLKGWNSKTAWNRFDGLMPHVIPADPDSSLKQDLVLYENGVIFAGGPAGQANPNNISFLQVPEMVKIGDTWKFIELPRVVDASKPLVASEGGIRSWIFREQASGGAVGQDPALEAAMKELAKYDEENATATSKKDLAVFHRGRIDKLQAVVKASKKPEEQLGFNKQIVDSLAAAYQTGLFPAGLPALDQLIAQGGSIGSYAAFRKIFAEFSVKNDEGGNVMATQKKWMADLKDFLDKYPKAEEAPDALLQLASANEFNAEEEEAKKYYEVLARTYGETEQGKKAAGALKRLDLVGKTLVIKGHGLNNNVVDTSRFRGKTVLVTFWATWAEPVKRDLPELLKSYQKHKGQGFEIVGVCLDERSGDLEQFLKEHALPWPQIYEPGGLEKNPLATEYGIIALPTMILVDAQGKVLNRNIRSAAELEKQLEKVLAGGNGGVALGAK
jgi:thiol-disulfide isomerase/thioredoxin